MVVVIGVLGNGLFGAGIRAVQERELNILRRVTRWRLSRLLRSWWPPWSRAGSSSCPISCCAVSGAILMYGMPVPVRLGSMLAFVVAWDCWPSAAWA